MRKKLGRSSKQDEDQTDALVGPTDPALLSAAGPGRFEDHPLFPRAAGSAETRDIKFVGFCRERPRDRVILNCPEDIPARDAKSWDQVVEWWGGGKYKAIAKDARHRTVACFPSGPGEWLTFGGESKPFVARSARGASMPGVDGNPPLATTAWTAPTRLDALLGMMAELLHEIRKGHVAPPPPAANGVLVALIQAQAMQNAAASMAQAAHATAASLAWAAHATAASEASARMMQTLLSVISQRSADSAARPAEPTTGALQVISAVERCMPAPAAVPGLAAQIPVVKPRRGPCPPASVALTNDGQPLVDIFGRVSPADVARTPTALAATRDWTDVPHRARVR